MPSRDMQQLQAQTRRVAERVLPALGFADAIWQPAPTPAVRPTCDTLAGVIDHTLLKPEATPAHIEHLCAEAREYGFYSVCLNPLFVAQAVHLLAGSGVQVATVIGFPLGATPTTVKLFEAQQALTDGANELDMVIPIGRLKAGEYRAVYDDIAAVAALCARHGARSKMIIETALLSEEEKIAACILAVRAGATFVKTSTGFAAAGATTADVALMRYVVGATVGVKASGGIRDYATACAMIAAGATRLGASASVAIVQKGRR